MEEEEDEGMPSDFPTTGTGGLADGGISAGAHSVSKFTRGAFQWQN